MSTLSHYVHKHVGEAEKDLALGAMTAVVMVLLFFEAF